MTSKVQPAENYGTDDVKMTSKVQAAVDYIIEPLTEKTWGQALYLLSGKTKSEMA